MRSPVNYRQTGATLALNPNCCSKLPMRYPGSQVDGPPAISMTSSEKRRWPNTNLLSIGLLGLALAVVLWGTRYKLSLYRPHPVPSLRASVAKLWVGPKTSVYIKGTRTKATTLPAFNFEPLSVRDFNLSYSVGSTLHLPFIAANGARFRLLLGTLRSPPPRYL
jgi:hypothetical protein